MDSSAPFFVLSFCKEILTIWQELHSKNPFTAKEYDNNIVIWNTGFMMRNQSFILRG